MNYFTLMLADEGGFALSLQSLTRFGILPNRMYPSNRHYFLGCIIYLVLRATRA